MSLDHPIVFFFWFTHYSKSQIFVKKNQFWHNPNIFTSFSSNFLTIFLVKSKLSIAKKSKTTTFSRVFHRKKIVSFLGISNLYFLTYYEVLKVNSNLALKGLQKISDSKFTSPTQIPLVKGERFIWLWKKFEIPEVAFHWNLT